MANNKKIQIMKKIEKIASITMSILLITLFAHVLKQIEGSPFLAAFLWFLIVIFIMYLSLLLCGWFDKKIK